MNVDIVICEHRHKTHEFLTITEEDYKKIIQEIRRERKGQIKLFSHYFLHTYLSHGILMLTFVNFI